MVLSVLVFYISLTWDITVTMAAKDCSGCGSTHEPPLHRRCPLRSGTSEDPDDSQDTNTQASLLHQSDTLVSEQQAKATGNQVSGSGLFDNSSVEQTPKTISTEVLLLRELKRISKRFNTLEQQAAKDRLVIADMASKLQAQEGRLNSECTTVLFSPRREQVKQGSNNVLNTVTNLTSVNQPLITGCQQGVFTQLPNQSVMKLITIGNVKQSHLPHTVTNVVLPKAPVSVSSTSQPHLQPPGAAAVDVRGNAPQFPATIINGPLPPLYNTCHPTGQNQIPGSSTLFSVAHQMSGNQSEQQQRQLQQASGSRTTTGGEQQLHEATVEEDSLIPSLQALRNSQTIHQKVNKRYQELEEAVQVSPGNLDILLDTIQKKVHKDAKKKVKWPQDLAFVGSLRKRPSYDQLTTCQWMLGFLRIRQEEQDPLVKENMVEYLTELLQDACDYSWDAAKGAHSVLLHRIQDGVVAWDNLKDVNKIRKRYAHTASSQYGAGSEKSKGTKVVPCFKYNKGTCTRGTDHEWQNMLLKHICQHCFSTFNKYEAHAKKDCFKAQKN